MHNNQWFINDPYKTIRMKRDARKQIMPKNR